MMLRRRLTSALVIVLVPVALGAQRPARDVEALATEGSTALEEKRFGDALEAFSAAAKLAPRDPGVALGVGVAAFMLGQNDDAEAWLQRSLKLDPGFVPASLWLGELLYREGRFKVSVARSEEHTSDI